MLAQSVAAMTAVVAAHVVAVSVGRWRSIDRDRRYRPFSTGRSLVHSTDTCTGLGFRDSFPMFFAYKNSYAKLRRKLVRGWTVSRYEEFDTSPETIKQELRPAVC